MNILSGLALVFCIASLSTLWIIFGRVIYLELVEDYHASKYSYALVSASFLVFYIGVSLAGIAALIHNFL